MELSSVLRGPGDLGLIDDLPQRAFVSRQIGAAAHGLQIVDQGLGPADLNAYRVRVECVDQRAIIINMGGFAWFVFRAIAQTAHGRLVFRFPEIGCALVPIGAIGDSN